MFVLGKIIPKKQDLMESFGLENNMQKGENNEQNSFGRKLNNMKEDQPFFNSKEDVIISGSNIKNPNTFEIKDEILILEKSIGSIGHNKSLSGIKFPSEHNKMESRIKPEEVFKEELRLLAHKIQALILKYNSLASVDTFWEHKELSI